ncbi:hypothetical protein GCM10022289_40250 [Pedobacter jeongneungensis]|uniref:Uncharacterized protein n=1 Tax=Pedobacter jeongneungensis TaxID=947309 RepID=A0ABP8BNL5_9SPHI
MKKEIKLSCFIILLVLFCFGCKKEQEQGYIKLGSPTKNTVIPYSFDWETVDYMPTPAGTQILVPWASNSNQSFPSIYGTDIKKSDGWELVYNTFSPTQFIQPAFFVLYNRYRGLLRGYFYLTPNTPIPSSNIAHSLTQKNNANPLPVLSYSSLGSADLSTTNNVSTLVQQYRTTSTGTWYAAEFEMAYDPNVGTKSAITNLMEWSVNSVNISDIKINGTSKGSIKGTIAQPVPAPDLLSSFFAGALQLSSISIINDLKLSNLFATSLKSSMESGIQGNIKNVVNAIYGGASGAGTDSTKQYVNLTTNTTYTLAGTSTDTYQISNPTMVIPGSSGQESVTGYSPLYTKAMGVMTLSSVPESHLTVGTSSTGIVYNFMKLDPNSYSIIWNPNVINNSTTGAAIQNLKQEIISYENYLDDTDDLNPAHFPSQYTEYDGDKPYLKSDLTNNTTRVVSQMGFVNIADYEIPLQQFSSCSGCDTFDMLMAYPVTENKKLRNHVLRISFDVVPNNGAPRSTIVKSFNIFFKGPKIYFPS